MRRLGHRMIEEMMDYLQQVRERPAWQKISGEALEGLQQPLPQHPQEAASVYEDFVSQVLPYNLNNIHPRFWAWVQGCGTPFGMLADMLASGMNPNLAIGDHSPVYVEHQVLNWSKELFGFPLSGQRSSYQRSLDRQYHSPHRRPEPFLTTRSNKGAAGSRRATRCSTAPLKHTICADQGRGSDRDRQRAKTSARYR